MANVAALLEPVAQPVQRRWYRFASTPLSGLAVAVASMLIMFITGTLVGYSALSLAAVGLVAWLAAENGGNDVAKGVAPLVAAGEASEMVALLYGTAITIMGSLLSIYVSAKVLKLFTAGILATGFDVTAAMTLAIAIGASLWVALATYYSLPVSTTHAIVGAIVTVGAFAYGLPGVAWGNLVSKVVFPLLFSPVVGLGLAWLISIISFPLFLRRSSTWLSSGVINFVRALNDTPKIVAIAFFAATISGLNSNSNQTTLYLLIGLAMAAGSLVKGLPILQLLSRKVTSLDTNLSLSASITAAGLILASSRYGLPVSTTHVTTSVILGAGLRQGAGAVNWRVVRDILLSWVITLPLAGLMAAIAYLLARLFV